MTVGSWSGCITTSPEVKWSVSVMGVGGSPESLTNIYNYRPDRSLRSAGLAKIIMLLEIARRIEAGDLSVDETRSRVSIPKIGNVGLWQHFEARRLPINDIALLVAATGDNLATNVLVRELGVDPILKLAKELGLESVTLTDAERNVRDAGDVVSLFEGAAQDWVLVLNAIYHGRVLSRGCALALNWLSHGLDTSMISSGFAQGPADGASDTTAKSIARMCGSLQGSCAEAGIVTTSRRTIAYSAVANWDYSNEQSESRIRAEVLNDMNRIGHRIFLSANTVPRSRDAIPA